jgi:ubiquitin-like 1-activating enzyme E1 A
MPCDANGPEVVCNSFLSVKSTPVLTSLLHFQAKISKAKVLYIHLTGVSSEILKNLVLAGVHATLCDARSYPDSTTTTPSFFLLDRQDKKIKYESVGHAMRAAVEELNPLLGDCPVVNQQVQDLDEAFLGEFDMIIASRINMKEASRISQAATRAGGKFYLVDCFGWCGAAVVDLGRTHEYREEVKQGKELSDVKVIPVHIPLPELWNVPVTDITMKRVDPTPPVTWLQYRSVLEYQNETNEWPSALKSNDFVNVVQAWVEKEAAALKDLDCFQEPTLKKWAALATAELSPVCAVMGGIMGNEVIKAISGKGEPANNTLLFDGMTGKCRNVLIQKK